LARTPRFVAAVGVEVVYPDDDPGEARFESETVRPLRDVQKHAQREDMTRLLLPLRVA
jgi:hypothetical protein